MSTRQSRRRTRHAPAPARARRRSAEQDPALQTYFSEIHGYDLLDARRELALAREIEQLEVEVWRALLSRADAVETVASAVASHLPERSPALAALARLARGAAAGGVRRGPSARSALINGAARKLREADVGRTALRAADAAVRTRFAADRSARVYLARVTSARAAHERAKHEFVTANLRLVIRMARRYKQQALPLADLIQEGNLGLMRAVERFDYRRGFRFSTYAGWWIRHSLNRALSDKARLVRVPVHTLEAVMRAEGLRERNDVQGLPPRDAGDVAAEAGRSGWALAAAQAARQPVSLDRSLGAQRDQTLHDVLAQPDAVDAEEACERAQRAQELQRLLGTLTPVEAEILRLRYGLGGGAELTLRQTGVHYGLSRERIRQIQQEALGKLRGVAREPGAPAAGTGAAA
jgi:RNA polymerase primary sigma factor